MYNTRGSYSSTKRPAAKSKYSFNSRAHDLNLYNQSNVSLESKIGATRAIEPGSTTLPEKIKTNGSFSLEKINNYSSVVLERGSATTKKTTPKIKEPIKFPELRKNINPEYEETSTKAPEVFYQDKIFRSLKNRENTYLMNLARQHFLQTIEAIRIGKRIRLNPPAKQISLSRKNQNFKTIFLDLDETLIHCDENAHRNATVRLNFPVEGGRMISVNFLNYTGGS